jgi:tRNA threonylcarbamoyladenosine biosynthesis protein TsaB
VIDDLLLAIETSSRQGSVALACGAELLATREVGETSHSAGAPLLPASERGISAGLLPVLRELLADCKHEIHELGVVAFSHGPGSFTGLRVAATLSRMLNAVHGVRVVAVPTLEVIAWNVLRTSTWVPLDSAYPRDVGAREVDSEAPQSDVGQVAVVLDAKRGQVYGAVYERRRSAADGVTPAIRCGEPADAGRELNPLQGASVHEPTTWLASLPRPLWVMGEGVAKHRDVFAAAEVLIVPSELWIPRAEAVAAIGRRMAQAGEFCPPQRIVPLYVRPPECEEVYESRRAEAKARRGQ